MVKNKDYFRGLEDKTKDITLNGFINARNKFNKDLPVGIPIGRNISKIDYFNGQCQSLLNHIGY